MTLGHPKPRAPKGHTLPKSMFRKIKQVHQLAQEAGLFMENRELLHCPHCGLLEDVGCYGLLMTYTRGKTPADSGLRFKKDKRGHFICPNCGAAARTDKEGKKTTCVRVEPDGRHL